MTKSGPMSQMHLLLTSWKMIGQCISYQLEDDWSIHLFDSQDELCRTDESNINSLTSYMLVR